jgi:hypothetical protein
LSRISLFDFENVRHWTIRFSSGAWLEPASIWAPDGLDQHQHGPKFPGFQLTLATMD